MDSFFFFGGSLYNKNYQNVNCKRFQITTVHFLTLKGHLACAIFDFDTHLTAWTRPQRATR
jgi:hypothetical protein